MPDHHPSTAVEFARALAWPIFGLVILVVLGGPVRTLLVRAADATASKVTVGTFSVEVQEAATSAGDPELGKLIRGLSSDGIRALVGVGEGVYETSASNDHAGLDELERAGLLRYDEKTETRVVYRLTPRGKKAFVLILDTITRQAAES